MKTYKVILDDKEDLLGVFIRYYGWLYNSNKLEKGDLNGISIHMGRKI